MAYTPPPDWITSPPEDLEGVVLLLEHFATQLDDPTPAGETLRRLLALARRAYDQAEINLKELHPLAFFLPSYEQALMLNCWMWGVNFPCCFASNRIGKTTVFAVNALLWLFPNNPQWLMFKGFRCPDSKRWIQVYPRPLLSSLLELQAFLDEHPQFTGDLYQQPYEPDNQSKIATLQFHFPRAYQSVWPSPPIPQGGQIWIGAPDADFHKHIIFPRWKSLLPKESILSENLTDKYLIISTQSQTNPRTTVHQIICKSYESEDTKWSGDAVQGIVLTEGFTQEILDEVKNRLTGSSFASWDYTPAEARNTGKRTALAYKVYKREEELPLRTFSFINFKVKDTPNRIMPAHKRADMLRMWTGRKEAKARIDGAFFSSSGLILEHLDKEKHTLPWSFEELQEKVPNGRIYRGLDPGLDHPSACVWAYLAPNNVYYIYRAWSRQGATISERCKTIIELSNNERESYILSGIRFYREVHPYPNSEPVVLTAADYHIFKEDETTGLNYSINYTNEGLVLTESTHMRPEDRAVKANNLFDPNSNLYTPHPITLRPPGSKVFFLVNETGVAALLEKFDNLFWDRYKAGENRGEPKDKVPIHGDDEFDALCYIVCGPYIHTSFIPPRRLPQDSEPEQLINSTQRNFYTPEVVQRMQQRQLQASGRPGHFG